MLLLSSSLNKPSKAGIEHSRSINDRSVELWCCKDSSGLGPEIAYFCSFWLYLPSPISATGCPRLQSPSDFRLVFPYSSPHRLIHIYALMFVPAPLLNLVFLFLAFMVAGPISSKSTIEGSSLAQAAFHRITCLAVIAGSPFTLSNLFFLFHSSPSLPPHPPETNQSGFMPLIRRRQCLSKGSRSSSDLEELDFVVCHSVSTFLVLYSRLLSLPFIDFDSCLHPLSSLLVLSHPLSPLTPTLHSTALPLTFSPYA